MRTCVAYKLFFKLGQNWIIMKKIKDTTKIFNSKGQWSIVEGENMSYFRE